MSRSDDDEDERPKKKAKKRVVEDDEDDERPSSRNRDDDDEDDDDDEEDEERPRKKFKKKSKSNKGLIIGLSVGGILFLMLICGVIGGWYLFLREGGPKAAYEEGIRAVEKEDWGTVYDRMTNEDRSMITGFMEMMKADPVKGANLKNKTGRDLFVAAMKEAKKDPTNKGIDNSFIKGTVEKVDQTGDTAMLTIKQSNGSTIQFKMVKQDGTWRMKGKDGLLK